MKKHEFVKPGKMRIESGHKTFDRQTNLISTGGMITNTQISEYIRPYNQTENCGLTVKEGQLQDYDLQMFKQLPWHVEKAVRENAKDKRVILYMFFHRKTNRERFIHGYVITDEHHNHIATFITARRGKSIDIINECSQYIVA